VNKTSLLAATTEKQFGSDNDRLVMELREAESRTVVYGIDRPEQVCLRPDGLTQSGSKYTAVGLRQVCSRLADNLGSVVFNLAGHSERRRFGPVDLPAAIDVFNRVVAARFDRLSGCRIVRDDRLGTIDGVLPPAYRRLRRLEAYEMLSSRLPGLGLSLHWASLEGRQLMVRLCGDAAVCAVADVAFRGGVYLRTSELVGERTMVGLALVRGTDGAAAVGDLVGTFGVPQTGPKFTANLGAVYDRAVLQLASLPDRGAGLMQLQHLSLALLDCDGERNRERCRTIADWLCGRGLARRTAKDVVARVLRGESGPPLGIRTGYDLFSAVVSEAAELPALPRFYAERAAYDLVIPRFRTGL